MLRDSVRKFQSSPFIPKKLVYTYVLLLQFSAENQLSIVLRLIHAIWPVVVQLLWLIANQMPRLCCQTLVQQMANSLESPADSAALFVVPLAALIVLLLARRYSSLSDRQSALWLDSCLALLA